MAIRLEKSGELMMIYGAPEDPAKQEVKNRRRPGRWLTLIAVGAGLVFAGPHLLAVPAVNHTLKAFLAAIW